MLNVKEKSKRDFQKEKEESLFQFRQAKNVKDFVEENYLIYLLTIPLKCSFALCLSPFYLSLKTARPHNISEPSIKSWLPQKILCGVLTILDVLWMLGMIRRAVPTKPKDPSQHVATIMSVIRQLYKCLIFKKLWANQTEFLSLSNFLLASNVPILPEIKWIPTKVAVNLLMIGYTALGLGYVDWVHDTGSIQNNLLHWWKGKVADGRFNFFLMTEIMPMEESLAQDHKNFADVLIGLCSVAGYIHRSEVFKNFSTQNVIID